MDVVLTCFDFRTGWNHLYASIGAASLATNYAASPPLIHTCGGSYLLIHAHDTTVTMLPLELDSSMRSSLLIRRYLLVPLST